MNSTNNRLIRTRSRPTASQEAAKRRQQTSKNTSDSKGDLKLGISLEESIQILNVKKELNPEEVEKNFKHLFEVNQKEKGGSFYLQSKVSIWIAFRPMFGHLPGNVSADLRASPGVCEHLWRSPNISQVSQVKPLK